MIRSTSRIVAAFALTASVTVASVGLGGDAPVASAATSRVKAQVQQCGNITAASQLTVDKTTLPATGTTEITVTGRSYQAPLRDCTKPVFGGIYVFFGWVKPGGQWGPSWKSSNSTDGLFGYTFSYPGEGGGDDTRDDGTGTVRLVAFSPGGESGDATPFHMDGSGNWQTTLTVRGSSYHFKNVRTDEEFTVDCLKVQCGVLTIGGHGITSRPNEQFTPINFTTGGGQVVVPPANPNPGVGGSGSAASGTGGSGSGGSGSKGAASNSGSNSGSGSASGGVSGGASGGDSGTDAASGGDPASDPASESATVGEAGSLGEAPDASVAEATEEREALDSSNTAAKARVQDFGGDDSGGGSGIVIGVAVALVAAVGATGAFLARKKRQPSPDAG